MLRQAGHEVIVYDKAPDVGGVWSCTRRYPGLTTQGPKAQYSLSDFPMPREYPEWPTGAQVQAHLAAYASHFGLEAALRLATEVTTAAPVPGGGWTITAAPASAASSAEQVRLRHHRPGQPGRGEHRSDRPAPAVEGAAPHRRIPQLKAAAAHPPGRGPVQVPAAARRGEVPARPGQRHARQHAQLDAHHCHGGKIIPFSMHNVDEVLADLGVNISAAVRAWHCLTLVAPAVYRNIAPAVLRRLPALQKAPHEAPPNEQRVSASSSPT